MLCDVMRASSIRKNDDIYGGGWITNKNKTKKSFPDLSWPTKSEWNCVLNDDNILVTRTIQYPLNDEIDTTDDVTRVQLRPPIRYSETEYLL